LFHEFSQFFGGKSKFVSFLFCLRASHQTKPF
jgi:hypothetical protein